LISHDPEITHYIAAEELSQLLDVRQYLGDAPLRARKMAETIRIALST
jgi:adenylosuccinate lyase